MLILKAKNKKNHVHLSMKKKSRILGIDPGSNYMGYAIIISDGKSHEVIDMGVATFQKLESHLEKIKGITKFTDKLLEEQKPDILAIEEPFYGKNVQSMLKLGRAQGAVISCALRQDIPVFEYTPRRVKQSVTGKGSASKEQVAAMVSAITGIPNDGNSYDATDAVAIALCHILSKDLDKKPPVRRSKIKNQWDQFLKNNPDRLKE